MNSTALYQLMTYFLENEYQPAILKAYALKRESDAAFDAKWGDVQFEVGGANTTSDFLAWDIRHVKDATVSALHACYQVVLDESYEVDSANTANEAMTAIEQCMSAVKELRSTMFRAMQKMVVDNGDANS